MDTQQKKIIGIHGLAGSGKTLVSKYLESAHGYTPTKFAAPLKNMLAVLLCSTGIADETNFMDFLDGDLKEVPIELLGGVTPRKLMQTLGSEWGRDMIHEDLWVRTWFGGVTNFTDPLISVDDLRYENEAQTIRAMGGRIIHLYRTDLARDAGEHPSENGLTVLPTDSTIFNNGSQADLYEKLDMIAGQVI